MLIRSRATRACLYRINRLHIVTCHIVTSIEEVAVAHVSRLSSSPIIVLGVERIIVLSDLPMSAAVRSRRQFRHHSYPATIIAIVVLLASESIAVSGDPWHHIRGGSRRNPPAPPPGDVGRSSLPPDGFNRGRPDGGRKSGRRRRRSGRAGGRSDVRFRPSPPPYSSSSSMPSDGIASKIGTSLRSGSRAIRGTLREVQDKLPGIQLRVEPSTTLKLRKTFHPLKATVLRLGADFNAQVGVWQFRSSWEDRVIGGTLSLVGRELQLSKVWRLTVDQSTIGAKEDLVTAVRFRAAVDLGTMKAYARFGFRTEKVSALNVYDGFTLTRRLPLDGRNERINLEFKARFVLPEPELEYSTESQRAMVGLGDVEVNIEELNLLLDY